MKKNILAIQMQSVIADREANYLKVETLVDRFCKDFKPDMIFLPEVWTSGWYCSIFSEIAEKDNKTNHFLANLAKKYSANVIGGSYIKMDDNNIIWNYCPIFNSKGELIGEYKKIHLYAPDGEAEHVKAGNTPTMVDIDGIRLGLSICYDIRFPELFRSYINCDKPPELLINLSAWPLTRKEQYSSMATSRAIENQSYFLALSQTGEIKNSIYNAGNSLLAAPMGNVIQKLDENEGALCAQIDTDEVQKVRLDYPNLANRKVFDFGFKPQLAGALANV